MLRRVPVCLLLITLFAVYFLFPPCTTMQTVSDRSDLRGKVINSATGEPVGGALVQLSGQEMQFSLRRLIRLYELAARSSPRHRQKARILQ